MRSATQRAARRWWNTEAIDLEIYFNIIFIRTKSDHCLVLSLSQSVTLSALCEFCSNWICQSHVMLDGFVKIYECITLPGKNFHDHWSRQISTLWWGQWWKWWWGFDFENSFVTCKTWGFRQVSFWLTFSTFIASQLLPKTKSETKLLHVLNWI